ncbi:hypothetical protein FA13DRAFT_1520376 [Coprinellus micaceus]|uniref:Uncharacterized protein n=1 Tax=Coprinellus micaceus TaxID=71717 RepID=A0A4Y7SKV3_COPMI|nr:hypothetical protein FA13DRAFT_1520376 [Coprinellus micaceus]
MVLACKKSKKSIISTPHPSPRTIPPNPAHDLPPGVISLPQLHKMRNNKPMANRKMRHHQFDMHSPHRPRLLPVPRHQLHRIIQVIQGVIRVRIIIHRTTCATLLPHQLLNRHLLHIVRQKL